jgi:hypothetical protein
MIAFSIFAGIVVFSIVFLYVKTADRWNWKKIVIWAAGLLLIPVIIFLVILAKDALFDGEPSPIKHTGKLTSFQGVAIGDKFSELEFKYGRLSKDGYEHYLINKSFGVYVDDESKKVSSILVFCEEGITDLFNGIACGDTTEKLVKKYGSDLKIRCHVENKNPKDNMVVRSYYVPKLATSYILEKNQVVLVHIKELDLAKPSKNWEKCE